MADRPGVGATAISAVIFAILLLSNFAVYVAAQQRSVLYSQADAEDFLADGGAAIMGAEAANILARAQSFLDSRVFYCANATAAIDGGVRGLTDRHQSGGLNVSVSAGISDVGTSADNLTMLSPFDGSVAGELTILLRVTESGGVPTSGITMSRAETHPLHLPVRLEGEERACTGAVQTLESALSSSKVANCTDSQVGPLVESASLGPVSAAPGEGYEIRISYSITQRAPCTAEFEVSVSQPDIDGPSGTFTVQMSDEGSATFASPEG